LSHGCHTDITLFLQVKEHVDTIKKLATEVAQGAKTGPLLEKMKTITEALAESNGRCTALEGTITELKEWSAQKEKALVEQTEVATSAENDMETQKKKVVVLTMELEKLRKTHECTAIDSRRALAEQRATHEGEYSAARVQWGTEMEATKQELTETSEELLQTQTLLRTSETSLAESKAAMEQLSVIEQVTHTLAHANKFL
jgi:chromosome segregation ATPase